MSAVFVLPVIESGRGAPVASLLSTAAWAGAGARLHGRSWIVTPDGILDPAEARRRGAPIRRTAVQAAGPDPSRSLPRRILRALPAPAETLAKDARGLVRGHRFRIGSGPWDDGEVDLVWQRHELFQTAGIDLAERLGVASVLFAPATKVWEAKRWGTTRPGWARVAERLGESPALRRADVVACGSPDVAEQVRRLGTPADRILITPNGVDLDRFDGGDRAAGRAAAGLAPDDPRTVVGWVGSFRPFHDLHQLVDAARDVEGLHLLLVGDGPERAAIEAGARAAGVSVTFTGTVGHDVLPDLLAAMDIAVVVTGSGDTFHYSPLKLGEYLAAGLPVVAPDVASIRDRVVDGKDVVLVPPGDVGALREVLRSLRDDPAGRSALGRAAQALAARSFSWDRQLRRISDHLAGRPDSPGSGRPAG